jgi:hypothetical protein
MHRVWLAVGLPRPDRGTDEPWLPPPAAAGKADGIDVLAGADIPSPLVEPDKLYLRDRDIGNLTRVGALDELETRLARRVDGIIANLPADGRLHIAELVRLGEPKFVETLFEDERERLPRLWQNGVRVDSTWVRLPEIRYRSTYVDMLDWVDYALVTPDRGPLARHVAHAAIEPNGTYGVNFVHALEPAPPPSGWSRDAVDAVATPAPPPAGSYQFFHTLRAMRVDVYPEGVLHAEIDGQRARLVPLAASTKYVHAEVAGWRVIFDYPSGELTVYREPGVTSVFRAPLISISRVRE